MSISLKQMRYAVAVAETAHFGRAAEQCHISQPALSQQIQLLEGLCGAPLFDRLKRSVRLTPFGREFVARARPVLEAAEALQAFAEGHTGTPDRPIRFGLIPTVAPYLLPDVFPALRKKLPALDFTISENKTESLLAGIESGSLDLALIATEPPQTGVRLHAEPLFDDPFVLATSAGETASEPVRLSSLEPQRILLLDEGHCFRDQAIAACGLDAEPGGRTFAATSLSTIVEFVANGQGVTLLPRIALKKEADERIAVHPLASPIPGRKLSLVWRDGTPFASTYEAMAEVIRAARGA